MVKIDHLQTKVHLLCLVGPGGCGKETKGKILRNILFEHMPVARFVMSELIEELKKRHSQSEHITRTMQRGGLVDDSCVIRTFAESVIEAQSSGSPLIIADGFPRTVAQSQWLLDCRVPFHILHIDIDEEESVKRIRERSKTQQRCDDDVVRDRYQTYSQETVPAIRHIKHVNPKIVTSIDGKLFVREQIVRMLRPVHALPRFKRIPLQSSIRIIDSSSHPAAQSIRAIDGATKPLTVPSEMVISGRHGDTKRVPLLS